MSEYSTKHTTSLAKTGKAKKSLGQHFLKDVRLASSIVEHLMISPDDKVLEIGPGLGALTEHIVAKRPAHLCLIEKDYVFAATHKAALPHAEVRCEDAMNISWPTFATPIKLISNLPYNIASPLMWDMLSQVPFWERAVFMVQKEVAERIVAVPNTKAYGALSVWMQAYATIRIVLHVGPGSFVPPPKVDSAVILCLPRPLSDRPQNPKALARMLKICFQMRRKQLQRILRTAGFDDAEVRMQALNLDPALRPEALSVHDFSRLAEAFF